MEDLDDVYALITKLCELHLKYHQKRVSDALVKKLRSNIFEMLLFKRPSIADPYWLENCTDYHCQFLTWEFILRSQYKQNKMADDVESCVQTIMASTYDSRTVQSIFHFLLKLKRPPEQLVVEFNTENEENVESHLNSKFKTIDFKLVEPHSNFDVKFSSESFRLTASHSKFFSPDLPPTSDFRPAPMQSFRLNKVVRAKINSARSTTTVNWAAVSRDVENNVESKPNIWEVMSKTKFTPYRTWESLGNPTPPLEKPFLSDASAHVYHLIEKLREIKRRELDFEMELGICPEEDVKVLTKEEYMNDLRLLVVGIPSNTFRESNDAFIMNDNLLFEDISHDAFTRYSMLMINVGICYKALSAMVTQENSKKHGYVYSEFCNAVNRYFVFYRAAVMNIPSNTGIIEYYSRIRKLSLHLFAVASICKVGTFKDKTCVYGQYGVDLLNFLYKKVFALDNKQVVLVLYGLLYPCLQIYFIKYLNPWIFEGIINDPYDEFFIKSIPKYLSSRGRTYWTRAFAISDHAVPDFCLDYAQQIFECGQMTNLLKLCSPTATIFRCLKAMSGSQRERMMLCCITDKQFNKLQRDNECYELEAFAMNGRPFSLRIMLEMKKDEGLIFNKALAAKRASSMKKMQLEIIERLSKYQSNDDANEERGRIADKQREVLKNEARKVITHYECVVKRATQINKLLTRNSEIMIKTNLESESMIPRRTANPDQSSGQSPMKYTLRTKKDAQARKSVETLSPPMPKRKIPKGKERTSITTSSPKRSLHKSPERATFSEAKIIKKKVLETEYGCSLKPNRPASLRDDVPVNTEVAEAQKTEGLRVDDASGNRDGFIDELRAMGERHNYIKPWKFEMDKISVDVNKSDKPAENVNENTDVNPMKIPLGDVSSIQFVFVNDYISRSMLLPIKIQVGLVKAELLGHFIVDQHYLTHIDNLRQFYFLLDGGFSRMITNRLFERLNNFASSEPAKIFDQKFLNETLSEANNASLSRIDEDECKMSLSFVATPKAPQLGDVFVLDCVSLAYETKWPLNILLPTKIMGKYDEIFKLLLKVHRVSWVLKQVYMDLKILKKQYRRYSQQLLALSQQYQTLHIWRHIMTHFVQTLQNYLVGEVLENSWLSFKDVLNEVNDIEDLYNAHAIYIRQIYFLYLLHQKTAPVREIVMNIFGIFLKFHEYLRSREWDFDGDEFVHPNYQRIECIYQNFLALSKYFIKICKKVARAAYQPQFRHLIDLLDINLFYSSHVTSL